MQRGTLGLRELLACLERQAIRVLMDLLGNRERMVTKAPLGLLVNRVGLAGMLSKFACYQGNFAPNEISPGSCGDHSRFGIKAPILLYVCSLGS